MMKSTAPDSSTTAVDSAEHTNLNRCASPQVQTSFSSIHHPTPQQQRVQDPARAHPGDHSLGKFSFKLFGEQFQNYISYNVSFRLVNVV